MDATEHDGLIAGVKHFPVALATALAQMAMDNAGWRERAKLASAEFRAVTNIAPSDAEAGAQEFLANREHLIHWLDEYSETLAQLRALLDSKNSAALQALLENIAAQRERWLRGDDEDAGAPMNMADVQMNVGRMFLGGLADRGKKLNEKGRG